MMGAFGQNRAAIAQALRGQPQAGGPPFGSTMGVTPGPSTPTRTAQPVPMRSAPAAGGYKAMPMGMGLTSLLDAVGAAKTGSRLPKGSFPSGGFMIGPGARQHMPGGYVPGQGQAVYKGNFRMPKR